MLEWRLADARTRRNGQPAGAGAPVIGVLLAGQALGSVGSAAVFDFLPLYAKSTFQADIALASLSTAVYFLAAACASIAAGELADRHGRRLVIVLGMSLGAASAIGLALAPTLPLMMVAAGAAGFFDSLPYPALQAVVADVVPAESRPLIFGRMYQALGVGWFLGPAIAGVLISRLGFGPVYVGAAAILCLAGMLFAWRLPETGRGRLGTPGGHADQPQAGGRRLGQSDDSEPQAGDARTAPWYRNRKLLVFVGLYLLTFGAYIQLFTVFPAEGLTRNRLSLGNWGGILALNGGMILAGQELVSRRVRRIHPPSAIAAGIVLWVLGFASLAVPGGPGWIALAMAVFTLGEMVVFPLQPAVVAELAPPADRGRYQGALALGGSIGNAAGPAIAGVAVAAVGPTWWFALAALSLSLALVYARLGRLSPPSPVRTGSPRAGT